MGRNGYDFKRMKTDRRVLFLVLCTSVFVFPGLAQSGAAPLNGARITYVSSDVRLDARKVSAGTIVSSGATINNGEKARSELTFDNRTVARLGAKTSLNLESKPAAMVLREGAILFQIPKGSQAAIETSSVVVTSKDAIGLLERNGDSYIKLLLLQGEARVALQDRVGESIVLKAGQILITNPKATSLPDAADFDIARAARTCQLISEFPPLPNQDSITLAARRQARLTNSGDYVPSNLVIFGRGTLVNLVPPRPSNNGVQKPTPNPQPAN